MIGLVAVQETIMVAVTDVIIIVMDVEDIITIMVVDVDANFRIVRMLAAHLELSIA